MNLTYSAKGLGHGAVEGDAERLVARMLSLAPEVNELDTQPFTVDLIDRRIYREPEGVTAARARHRGRLGPKFYTPDFEARGASSFRTIVEVKLEGFVGTDEYLEKLARAREVVEAHGYEFIKLVVPANPRHPLRTNVPLLTNAATRKDLWPSTSKVDEIELACGEGGASVAVLCRELRESPISRHLP